MKAFALGVIADLRGRRLLPVAVVLLVALVAVPVLLRESPEPAPPPAGVAQPAAGPVPGGLPSPDAALAREPLVTMASLEASSTLASFDSRDPFKPLQSLADVSVEEGLGGLPGTTAASADAPALGGGLPDLGGGSEGGAPSLGDAPSPGGGGDPSPGGGAPSPSPSPDPAPRPTPDPEPQRLTYAVDVSLAGPDGERRVRGLPRLAMLPSATAPLLIFLGVSDSGDEAIFLVDAKLTAETGEGDCQPSAEECATVELQPGEIQSFVDADGNRYVLSLDQIREVNVVDAAAARERLSARASASARSPQRLVPLLVDVFTGGQ